MKISIYKQLIYKSLFHIQSIVDKKNTLSILGNILLEAKDSSLVLSATDMDISINEKINCSIVEEGSVTVPVHTLYDIVRKIPDGNEIEFISNDGKRFSIRSGKSKFSLSCLPKDDFPLIEIEKLQSEFVINSKTFLNILEKTRFAISNEETRYFFNGIYFHKSSINNQDNLSLVATDGHRLAKVDFPFTEGLIDIPGIIVPKKTIYELCKLLANYDEDIVINIDPNKIIFYIDKITFISKLIDGNFPEYEKVIPKNNNNILKVNKESFCEAVDRVSTITSDKSRVIKHRKILLQNIVVKK